MLALFGPFLRMSALPTWEERHSPAQKPRRAYNSGIENCIDLSMKDEDREAVLRVDQAHKQWITDHSITPPKFTPPVRDAPPPNPPEPAQTSRKCVQDSVPILLLLQEFSPQSADNKLGYPIPPDEENAPRLFP